MAPLASARDLSAKAPIDLHEERCPLCKQILPHDLNAHELQARLDESRREAARAEAIRLQADFEKAKIAAVEAARKEMAAQQLEREKRIHAEAKRQTEGEIGKQLKAAQAATAKAENEKRAAEERAKKAQQGQEELVKVATEKALREQRAALDKEHAGALRRKEADGFAENQKLKKQVDALKRQLEKKTAAELGEGAEIDLLEALKESFPEDKFKPIKKGQPGADIEHKVIHNGRVCGTLLYDSKNHRAWRDEFVEKLKIDQLAAKADHAILASSAFPAGKQQLCVRNGVIVTNPARVVELVGVVRGQIIHGHRLRLGDVEKLKKTETLYEYINSNRCQQLLARQDSLAESLLELDAKEVATHERTWRERGKLIRDSQKAHGDFRAEIDRIVEGDSA